MKYISANEFKNFLSKDENINNGKITLEDDIYLEETNEQNQTKDVDLCGTFDGNGYTIYNIKQCLFSKITENAIFKDVNIRLEGFNSIRSVICNQNNGLIKNVKITAKDATIKSDTFGTVTTINHGVIDNCDIYGDIVLDSKENTTQLGGITFLNTGTVKECNIKASLSCTHSTGGIVWKNKHIIKNCTVTNSIIAGQKNSGGISGISIIKENTPGKIMNCTIKNSTIELNYSSNKYFHRRVGGIVGENANNIVKDCTVYNCDIEGYDGVGGIVGVGSGRISNCQIGKYSKISGRNNVGSIVGKCVAQKLEIQKCLSDCTVVGTENIGGLVGQSSKSLECTALVYNGTIDSAKNSGLLFGILKGNISQCIYTGKSSKTLTGEGNSNGLFRSNIPKEEALTSLM